MSVDTFSTVFATLSLVSLVGALVIAVQWLRVRTATSTDGAAAARGRLATIGKAALPAAWLVAAVSTGGSLYYSEVAEFTPCVLCWWQRIAMYPLVVVLLVALVAGDRAVRRYVTPVTVIGALIAAYHYVLQRFPTLTGTECSIDAPCTAIWVRAFGFVSIPFMAFSGFVLITMLMTTIGERRELAQETP